MNLARISGVSDAHEFGQQRRVARHRVDYIDADLVRASSTAIARLVTIAAPLLPLYQTRPGRGRTPAVDAIVMSTPPPFLRKYGTNARALWNRLFTLTA